MGITFTGSDKSEHGPRDLLDCEQCGYKTSVLKNTQHIPSMKCPQCGKTACELR